MTSNILAGTDMPLATLEPLLALTKQAMIKTNEVIIEKLRAG